MTTTRPATYPDAPPSLSRSRFTLNGQLYLFGPAKQGRAPLAPVESWALLGLVLVAVPWALIGWLIATLT